MGRVGTVEVYTQSNGWVEIDLYDPSDFSFTPIEMQTATGWGVPFVTDPASADTPLEVYTQSNGWQGINTVGYITMDDFEDNDLEGWVESKPAASDVSSGRAAFQGNYGLTLSDDTCERIASAPFADFSPQLPEYPTPGETWDVFFRYTKDAATKNDIGHRFGCQKYPTSDDFAWTRVCDGYRILFDLDDSPQEFLLTKVYDTDGDGHLDTSDTLDRVDFDYVKDQWYRVETDWHDSTSDQIIVTMYEVTTDDWEGTQVAQLSATDTEFGEGAMEVAGENGTHFDLLRRTNPL